MIAHEAIRVMLKKAGKTQHAISQSLGKSKNWLSSTLYLADDSRANTVAQIARACGFALVLIPRGSIPPGALVIDGKQNFYENYTPIIYSISVKLS